MEKKKGSRKQMRRKFWKVVLMIFLIWFSVGVIQNRESIGPLFLASADATADSHRIPASGKWNLIVVNRWNKIPEDFSVSLTELENGRKVDSRIYPYLQEMFDAAREDGIYPIVREGYRTQEEQEAIFDEKVQAYMEEGYSRTRAESAAKEWVALPGTSEHQLGIAVDINADKTKSTNDEVYAWLAENAYKYGFILRYPNGKEKVTGTGYEPWHYRYVGVENAQIIYKKQEVLEEFVKNNPPVF